MAEHGTRTMYVHYKCRCDECCRAEHRQYLKRKETRMRRVVSSKWGDHPETYNYDDGVSQNRRETQRRHNKRRHLELTATKRAKDRIKWQEIADKYEMRCAICGCVTDPTDMWMGKSGRLCYGRKYPTVDHIIPLRQGGTDSMDNVQLACKHCNSAKGAKLDVFSVGSKQQIRSADCLA